MISGNDAPENFLALSANSQPKAPPYILSIHSFLSLSLSFSLCLCLSALKPLLALGRWSLISYPWHLEAATTNWTLSSYAQFDEANLLKRFGIIKEKRTFLH